MRWKLIATLLWSTLLLSACAAAGTSAKAVVGMTEKSAANTVNSDMYSDTDSQIEEVRALLSAEMSRVGGGHLAQEDDYDPLAALDSYNYLNYWLSNDANYEQTSTWGQEHTYRIMWCLNTSGYDFTETARMLMEDEQYCRFLLYIIMSNCAQNFDSQEELLEVLLSLSDHEQWRQVVEEFKEQNMTLEALFARIEEPDQLYGMDTIIGLSALEIAAEELLEQKYDIAVSSLSDDDIKEYCGAFLLVKELKGLGYLAIKENVELLKRDGDSDKAEFLAEELHHLETMSVTNLIYGVDYKEYAKENGDSGSTSGLPFVIIPLEGGEEE